MQCPFAVLCAEPVRAAVVRTTSLSMRIGLGKIAGTLTYLTAAPCRSGTLDVVITQVKSGGVACGVQVFWPIKNASCDVPFAATVDEATTTLTTTAPTTTAINRMSWRMTRPLLGNPRA